MKSIVLASILAVTPAAWATPTPTPLALTHGQLVEIVHHADADLNTAPGFVGALLIFELCSSNTHPYFVAAEDRRGIAFIYQTDLEGLAGGPVAATLVSYECREDACD